MTAEVQGSMTISQGGERLAIGDNNGSIIVLNLNTTSPLFEEKRDGARGKVRAFRAIAMNPGGTIVAALSKDNIVRVWHLQSGERQNFKGFIGSAIEFDMRGERLLLIGEDGQPKLLHLNRQEIFPFDKPFTPIDHLCFSRDYQHIFAAGPGGFIVYQTATLQIVTGQAAQKMSGLVSIASHPYENKVAMFSKRSAYLIDIPSLEFTGNFSHGAPNPGNSGLWTLEGVSIGGADGIMHSREGESAIPPTTGVYACGDYRLLMHHNQLTIFTQNGRQHHVVLPHPIRDAKIARNGKVFIVAYESHPIQAYQFKNGQALKILDGPPNSVSPTSIWASPTAVAVELQGGGCNWWNFQTGQGLQIPWARHITLTEGGKWLGVITPQGHIQIIDTRTGKKALVDPKPTSPTPIVHIAFMGKSSLLLALDADGYLISYDLSQGMIEGADGEDIIQINSTVHRLQGMHGGEIAAILLADEQSNPEQPTGQLLMLPIQDLNLAGLFEQIPLAASINPKTGSILQPAPASAALEEQLLAGNQVLPAPNAPIVYRALPNNEWIVFNEQTTLAMSANVYNQL
jgi:WD40 repeat protein